jgi:hypothetical protein
MLIRAVVGFLLCLAPVLAEDQEPPAQSSDNQWRFLAQTGYAWTGKLKFTAGPSWTPTTTSINDTLYGAPFYSLGVGKTWARWIETNCSYTSFQTFRYVKYQQPVQSSDGNRMRFFDLDLQNIQLNLLIDPIRAKFDGPFSIPFGAGVGASFQRTFNFSQIVYDSAAGVGSVITQGLPSCRTQFCWECYCSIRCRPSQSRFTFDIGYQLTCHGQLRTTDELMTNNSIAQGNLLPFDPWQATLWTNALCLLIQGGW